MEVSIHSGDDCGWSSCNSLSARSPRNGSHHPARASKATMSKTADRVLGVHGLVMRHFHALNEYDDCSQGTTRTLENSPLTIIAAARADANNAPGKLIA